MSMKFLYMDESKCTGCLECMYTCSYTFDKVRDLEHARLWITKVGVNQYKMKSCMQCEDAPCMAACPENAIRKVGGRVIVVVSKCVGHGACVAACPFGVIYQHAQTNKAVKCITCGQCVKACPENALSIISADALANDKRKSFVKKLLDGTKVTY